MTWVTLNKGLIYPPLSQHAEYFTNGGITLSNAGTVDAAGEMVAFMGNIFIEGRPASAKTLSSAGGKIHWLPSTTTFANAGTTLRIGVQDISTSAGPCAQPDESWTSEPYDDLVGGTDTITANSFNTLTISTGSRSIAHGDPIAVVFDMTARGGTDSVIVRGMARATNHSGWPGCNTKAPSWATVSGSIVHPLVVIEFDDGTLGWFEDSFPVQSSTNESFSDSSNPDERGMTFTVPFVCTVDAFALLVMATAATADYTVYLYSNALGTPAVVASVARLGEQSLQTNGSLASTHVLPLSAPVTLRPGVTYAIAAKATGASNIALPVVTLGNANWRKMLEGSTSMSYAARNWSTGSDPGTAFTETTTKWIEGMGVRIRQIGVGFSPTYQLGI
jgi:hypothetical protein